MDRSWMRKAKRDTAYEDGFEQFLAFAYRDIPQDSYTTWVHHGENYERPIDPFVDVPNITGILGTSGPVQDDQHGESDSMQELLQAALGMAATMSEGGVDDFHAYMAGHKNHLQL
ncbi:hypothetical protein PVAP13_6NG208206 [Panicum virgatum]|uniref:Uncharacterized protein n=1 Tax=Panicum virgatum TaxID=38727 RepID=A0A8T0QWB7_PANVG|nr:hypothetical protein PVAP13_6NG208206 [Panicum virgatum]